MELLTNPNPKLGGGIKHTVTGRSEVSPTGWTPIRIGIRPLNSAFFRTRIIKIKVQRNLPFPLKSRSTMIQALRGILMGHPTLQPGPASSRILRTISAFCIRGAGVFTRKPGCHTQTKCHQGENPFIAHGYAPPEKITITVLIGMLFLEAKLNRAKTPTLYIFHKYNRFIFTETHKIRYQHNAIVIK